LTQNLQIQMAHAELEPSDWESVESVLTSGRLSMGPMTEEFERLTASYCGAKFAVAVNSGTAGLHLLAIAAGIERDDEVITTSFSFVASTNCFLYEGAKPVFVDIEPQTYCIDPSLIEDAISDKTKAIIAVDVFGEPADWQRISEIADKHNIRLIADSCESLGAEYKGKKTGPFGCGGVFAYFPNKQITTGEGGMIVTNDEEIYRICRSLRNQGRDDTGEWLGHVRLGYNYRIDEMSAALGVSQMRRIDEILRKREQVASLYSSLLEGDPRIRIPQHTKYGKSSTFVYVVEMLGDFDRTEVSRRLALEGIPTRGYFSPIHMQPYLSGLRSSRALPVTERVARRTIALPFHTRLGELEVRHVVKMLSKVLDDVERSKAAQMAGY
jgi:perosamine synthetase